MSMAMLRVAAGARVAVMVCLSCIASLMIAAAPTGATRSAAGGDARSELVFVGQDGKLQYKPDANGNTIPDFPNCGYRGGGVAIRDLPVRVTVFPISEPKDDTPRLQKGIDEVSGLPV